MHYRRFCVQVPRGIRRFMCTGLKNKIKGFNNGYMYVHLYLWWREGGGGVYKEETKRFIYTEDYR